MEKKTLSHSVLRWLKIDEIVKHDSISRWAVEKLKKKNVVFTNEIHDVESPMKLQRFWI